MNPKGNHVKENYWRDQAMLRYYFKNPQAMEEGILFSDLPPATQEQVENEARLMQCNGFRRCG